MLLPSKTMAHSPKSKPVQRGFRLNLRHLSETSGCRIRRIVPQVPVQQKLASSISSELRARFDAYLEVAVVHTSENRMFRQLIGSHSWARDTERNPCQEARVIPHVGSGQNC